MSYNKLLKFRPEGFTKKFGEQNKVCAVNMKNIMNVFKHEKIILMACNIRIKHVVPGIMKAAEELDAIVGFELAKNRKLNDILEELAEVAEGVYTVDAIYKIAQKESIYIPIATEVWNILRGKKPQKSLESLLENKL